MKKAETELKPRNLPRFFGFFDAYSYAWEKGGMEGSEEFRRSSVDRPRVKQYEIDRLTLQQTSRKVTQSSEYTLMRLARSSTQSECKDVSCLGGPRAKLTSPTGRRSQGNARRSVCQVDGPVGY